MIARTTATHWEMIAAILESSASAYAGYATSLLIERRPELEQLVGRAAFTFWKDELTQRVRELSAAVAENEPKLFVSQIDWIRQTAQPANYSDPMLKASLECLKEVLDEELPDTNDDAVSNILEIAIKSFDSPPALNDVESLDGAKIQLANRYLDLVLDGDARAAIDLIVNEGMAQFSIDELLFEVLLHAQSEVGSRWHLGNLRISEEHHVTATTQRTLAILSHLAESEPSNGLTVVSAAVTGNSHDIGVRAVGYSFERAGWRSICLGSDSPPSEIANAVSCFSADLVLVSAALSTHLKAVRQTIDAIRNGDSASCKILVGGLAFRDAPELWKQLKADGYADSAAEAIKLAKDLQSDA